jgi:hypothetical protein
MKILILLLMTIVVVVVPSSAAKRECVRWTWSGDVYNRVAICLEWRDRDTPKKVEKK